MKNKIYAKKGEAVLCTNGHVVFHFIEEVMVGEYMNLLKHVEYEPGMPKPFIGQRLNTIYCNCGARYVSLYDSGVFHFADGWRRAVNCKEEINE